MTLKIATCREMYYEPGEYYGRRGPFNEVAIQDPSKLILKILIDNENEIRHVSVGRIFKQKIGRLTHKRRDLIDLHKPDIILVEGNGYDWFVDDDDLLKWVLRVKNALT